MLKRWHFSYFKQHRIENAEIHTMYVQLHLSASIITWSSAWRKWIHKELSNSLTNLSKKVSDSFFCSVLMTWELRICLKYSIGSYNSTENRMYDELNERIEKVSKLVYVAFVHLSLPGIMLPAFIMTVSNYFSSKPKNSVYILPYFGV